MKSKLLFLGAIFTVLLCTSGKPRCNDIQGTRKLIVSQGAPIAPPFEQIKLITENSYFWHRFDAAGKVYTGAGGFYTLKGDVYTETKNWALPGMTNFLGKESVYQIEIHGDKMYISGAVGGTVENTEVWVRVVGVPSATNSKGTWYIGNK